MRIMDLLKKYWLVLLWLAFGPITADAARNPGFVLDPDAVPYPWLAALFTWARLGVECAVFFLILRSGRRLPWAVALAAILFFLSIMLWVTDMPGYHYVPAQFHFVLLLLLGLVWVAKALKPMPETGEH